MNPELPLDQVYTDLALAQDPDLLTELAQLRAKASLEMLLGRTPRLNWRYSSAQVARNATFTLSALRDIATVAPDALTDVGREPLLVAQAWEGLANLGEGASRSTALLNAAVAYELAGYQANAACLARLAADRNQWTTRPILLGVISAFIQRLFLRVRTAGEALTQAPEFVPVERDLARLAASGVAGQALMHAAEYFLSGNYQAIDQANERLALAARGFAAAGDVVGDAHVRNLRALLPVMVERSTWRHLADISEARRWKRYVRVLARGLKLPAVEGRSISELWPSQRTAIDSGLLANRDNIVVRMPTSSGKTRIAEMAMVKALVDSPGARCLYVAPFRALVSEITESFSFLFSDLGYSSSSVVGAFEDDAMDQLAAERDDVVVLTPEKLDLVLRINSQSLADVSLVVLDEGHLVGDERRGAKFELLVTRLRSLLPAARFLLLSAVVPDETLSDFSRWMGREPESAITSDWRPALLRVAGLDWANRRGMLRFERTHDDAALERFVPGVISEQTFEVRNEATHRMNTKRFPTNKGEGAAETAYQLIGRGPVLIFTTRPGWTESIGNALLRRIRLAVEAEEELPKPLQPLHADERLRSMDAAIEWLGREHVLTKLLGYRLAIHHGKLPDAVRLAVEEDFRDRRLAALVATNTLAQGVNLPVSTTIIHSCWRVDEDGVGTRILAREYWNIAGRTGRAGEETEGTLIHLLWSEQDRRDFRHFLRERDNLEPVESTLFPLLEQLIAERITPTAVGEALDAEILAMLVEEAAGQSSVEGVLSQTLGAVQAERRGVSFRPMVDAVVAASRDIRRRVGDVELMKVYSSTGLTSTSCEQLRAYALDLRNEAVPLLTSATLADLQALSDLLIGAVEALDEMQSTVEQPADVRQVVDLWILGTPVSEIARQTGANSVESLSRFVEEYASYLLPWGISAFLRIAQDRLDFEATPVARTFPAMLKWGVPTIEATWAHSFGIGSRQIAIALGERYAGASAERSPANFRDWVRQQEIEVLADELGITGASLQETTRALVRSRRSTALVRLEAGELLPLRLSIKVGAHDTVPTIRRAAETTGAALRRDYFNLVNRNSVVVDVGRLAVGYLPWDISTALAPEIDAGMLLSATIERVREEATDTWIDLLIDHVPA